VQLLKDEKNEVLRRQVFNERMLFAKTNEFQARLGLDFFTKTIFYKNFKALRLNLDK